MRLAISFSPVRAAFAAIALAAVAIPGSGAEAAPQGPVHLRPLRPPTGKLATVFNLTPAAPAPPGTCPAPTLAQCKTIDYLVSACGQASQTACQTLLKPEYQAYYDGLPVNPDRPMFPYGKPTSFPNLKSGKFIGALPTRPPTRKGAASSTISKQRQQWASHVPVVDPKTFVPDPTWEANGQVIESCEEYVSEKYYDYYRWETATTLCKGDYQCELDVAYVGTPQSGAPRIAKRTLVAKDGATLKEQPYGFVPGPKNIFFARGSYFIGGTLVHLPGQTPPFKTLAELKAMFPAFATDLDELKAALDDGGTFYASQQSAGVNEVYADVWAWHAAMRNKTKNISENEFEEFARRAAEFETLADQVLSARPPSPVAVNKYVPAVDLVTVMGGDPFQRLQLWSNDAARTQRVSAHAAFMQPKANLGANIKGGGGAVRFALPEGLFGAPQNVNPIKTGVAPQTATATAGIIFPHVPCPTPQIMTYDTGAKAGMNQAAVDRANAAEVGRASACKLLNLTMSEWFRRKAQKAVGVCNDRGSCGCLDLGAYGCDWSPKMFHDAYAKTRAMSEKRDYDYQQCNKWSFAGFPNIAANDKKDVTSLDKYLVATRNYILKLVANIPRPDPNTSPGVFGQAVADEEVEGNEGSFSAGYKYDVGWTVKANDWYPNATDPNRKPCSLEGNARGGFWARFTTPLDDVLGDVSKIWRHAIDADAWARVNENKNHELRYEGHLLIANQQQFATPDPYKPGADWGYAYNANDPKTFNRIELNHATKLSPLKGDPIDSPKLSITVMAGPVPITGAVWVELRYGADVELMAKTPKQCDANLTLYEASASFIPWAELDAVMTVGVGITGIAYVGVRGDLNILRPSLPLTASTNLSMGQDGTTMNLQFGMSGDMLITTLSGRLSLYVEFLFWDHEFELFRWNGLGPYKVHLFDLVSEKIPLFSLRAFEKG